MSPATLDLDAAHRELRGLLLERSLRFGDFLLSSGRRSDFYFDGKSVTLEGRGLHLVAALMLARCRGLGVSAVGGLTLGADPIAAGIAALSGGTASPLRAFIVRKERKEHGTGRWIEGPELGPGDRCAVVDDTLTTGSSLLVARDRVVETGAEVVGALVIVDRDEGGAERLAAAGLPCHALYRRGDFPPPG